MAPRKKPARGDVTKPPPPSAADIDSVGEGSDATIRAECEKAMKALKVGNSSKAMKLMKETAARWPHAAYVHRASGHMHLKLAAMMEDSGAKQRHFKGAMDAARQAAVMAPRSVAHAHFYAQLLFEMASDSKAYDEVVQVCDRALAVEDPLDPAQDRPPEEAPRVAEPLATADARVAHMRTELKSLVQKAHLASLSTWMQTMRPGPTDSNDRLRILQVRKFPEDPMEPRVSQSRRAHEVKKTVKTSKERREEIEVRVAAARLLQQRQDSQGSGSEHVDGDEGEGTSGRRRGGDKRRKDGPGRGRNGKPLQIEERIERVQPLWRAYTPEERLEMLDLSIEQIKTSLSSQTTSSKPNEGLEALAEALAFAQEKKTWRFWVCCNCGEKFTDSQEHVAHVMRSHVGKLTTKQQKMLPQDIDPDWQELLLEEDVRPIQSDAAIKILIQNAQSIPLEEVVAEAIAHSAGFDTGSEGSNGSIGSRNSSGSLDQFVDQVVDNPTAQQIPTCTTDENGEVDGERDKVVMHQGHVCNGDCRRSLLRSGGDTIQSLPLADGPEDEERCKLLKRIHAFFRSLLKARVLNGEQVLKVVQYAMEEMQTLLPASELHYEFNPSPMYIRFLNPTQLETILKYLMDLAGQFGVERIAPDSSSRRDDILEEDIIQDRLLLNDEYSKIHLDERILKEVEPPLLDGKQPSEEEKDNTKDGLLISEQGIDSSASDGQIVKVGTIERENKCDEELATCKKADANGHVVDCQTGESAGVHGKENGYLIQEKVSEEEVVCVGTPQAGAIEASPSGKNDRVTGKVSVQGQETKLIMLGELEVSQERKKVALEKQQQEEASLRRPLPLMRVKNGNIVPHVDLQLSWIFGKMEYELQPNAWKQLREEMAHKGKELCEGLRKEMVTIQELCDKKRELVKYENGLKVAENLCAAEASRREQNRGSALSYDVLLRRRKEEIEDMTPTSSTRRAELKAIENVLNHMSRVQISRFPYSRTVSDSDEDDEAMVCKNVRVDTALGACREDASKQQMQLDWKLMRAMDALSKQEARLNQASVLDYRAVVLPIVKSFLQNRLERAVEKDAQQKSDAAQEKFLAELANDKGPKPGEGRIGPKPREKKKAKDLRKTLKDQKRPVSNGSGSFESNGLLQPHSLPYSEKMDDGEEEEAESEVDDGEESRIARAMELRRLAEVEAEERQLVQALEKQRRAEEQAKLQRLAQLGAMEQNTNNGSYASIDPADMAYLRELEQACEESRLAGPSDDMIAVMPAQQISTGLVSHSKDVKCQSGKPTSPAVMVPLTSSYIEKTVSAINSNGVVHTEFDDIALSDSQNRDSYTGQPLELEEDEVKFQADLEQAMLQSLDDANKPLRPRHNRNRPGLVSISDNADLPNSAKANIGSGSLSIIPVTSRESLSDLEGTDQAGLKLDEAGKGLQNEVGQYNCFLNVVIQSLWHIKDFKEKMLAEEAAQHVHQGEPCVVCALRGIFTALSASALGDDSKEPIAPTALRLALSAMYSQTDFFQESQMNDASEVLSVIFDCLHRAFSPSSNIMLDEDESSEGSTSGLCESECGVEGSSPDAKLCMAHSLFGLDITEKMKCTFCNLESRHFKYTTFFHNVNASALRMAKMSYKGYGMDELLRDVVRDHRLACDLEAGGCGEPNYIDHILRVPPQVFTMVLGWQNGQESEEDIALTVEALSTRLSINAIYLGLSQKHLVELVSVVCYYGQHYHCFAFNRDLDQWIMFDDTTVKVVGTWNDVTRTCRRGRLQAQVLFYEAIEEVSG